MTFSTKTIAKTLFFLASFLTPTIMVAASDLCFQRNFGNCTGIEDECGRQGNQWTIPGESTSFTCTARCGFLSSGEINLFLWYDGEANVKGMPIEEQRFKGKISGAYLCGPGTTISYTHETGNGLPKQAVIWLHKEETNKPVDITLECTCQNEANGAGMSATGRVIEMEIDAATASVTRTGEEF